MTDLADVFNGVGAFGRQIDHLILVELCNQWSEELTERHVTVLIDIQQLKVVLGILFAPKLITCDHD